MKTPMQEHIEWMQEKLRILVEYKDLDAGAEVDECIQHAESMLEKEKEVMCQFAMDYVFSGEVGCAQWADGPAELDIEKSARDYYNETFNTKEK